MVHARWTGDQPKSIEVVSLFSGRDRAASPTARGAPPLDDLRKSLVFPNGFNSPRDVKPTDIFKQFQTWRA